MDFTKWACDHLHEVNKYDTATYLTMPYIKHEKMRGATAHPWRLGVLSCHFSFGIKFNAARLIVRTPVRILGSGSGA